MLRSQKLAILHEEQRCERWISAHFFLTVLLIGYLEPVFFPAEKPTETAQSGRLSSAHNSYVRPVLIFSLGLPNWRIKVSTSFPMYAA
jgi:hypothetical protein